MIHTPDIVDRLRRSVHDTGTLCAVGRDGIELWEQAADEITRLRAALRTRTARKGKKKEAKK